MLETIKDIIVGIQNGRFVSEAAVSQGVVVRVLRKLGWPDEDTTVLYPQYPVEGRNVDYALCNPPNAPQVFVEVKRPGNIDNSSDRQLFEYASYKGIPLAVLTDGRQWTFFLPQKRGDFAERRVYKLDLLERDVNESSSRLARYLEYENVCTGAALKSAEEDHQSIARERTVRRFLPEAWRRLIDE